MNYLDILQDHEVMAILTQIDIANQDKPKHYGVIHVLGTLKYAKTLAKCFGLTAKEQEMLYIACVLHTLGHLNGISLHEQTGSEMARVYLKKHGFQPRNINITCNAIESHRGRREDNFYDNVSACLILADKMNFGADRIKDELANVDEEFAICNQITYVDVQLKNGALELLLGGENVDWDGFIATATYAKLYRCFKMVGKKYGYKFIPRVTTDF
jgi:hypothetical protein